MGNVWRDVSVEELHYTRSTTARCGDDYLNKVREVNVTLEEGVNVEGTKTQEAMMKKEEKERSER